MDTWNPPQYEKFQQEREQPFFDLLALIQPAPSMRVVDLGCGAGHLTRRLHQVLHLADTTGVDRSVRMLEAAQRDPLPTGLRFAAGTIESFAADGMYDLIFSNAAFHWIEDHPALIRRLFAALRPGGQLAFQVPAMHHAISHTLPDEIASTEPFVGAFADWRRPQPVLEPEEYAHLFFRVGFAQPKVRVVIYPHVLADREQVVEWMKGSLLTEYEKHLTPDQFAGFTATYRDRLIPLLDPDRPFLFPFKRILCWGRKA
ncbi:MAG: methyltransferase domain-containing protein [Acidobacteriota bacterium]